MNDNPCQWSATAVSFSGNGNFGSAILRWCGDRWVLHSLTMHDVVC